MEKDGSPSNLGVIDRRREVRGEKGETGTSDLGWKGIPRDKPHFHTNKESFLPSSQLHPPLSNPGFIWVA